MAQWLRTTAVTSYFGAFELVLTCNNRQMDTLNSKKWFQTYRSNHKVSCSPLIKLRTTSKSLFLPKWFLIQTALLKELQTCSSQPQPSLQAFDDHLNPIAAILHGRASWGTSSGLVISSLPLILYCVPSHLLFSHNALTRYSALYFSG